MTDYQYLFIIMPYKNEVGLKNHDTILEANMRRLSYFLFLLVLLYSLSITCKNGKSSPQGRGGGMSAAPLAVDAMVIQPQLLDNKIITTGTLLANEEVQLKPEIAGKVTDVLFTEGSRVSKGDLLLKINDRELEAQLKGKEIEEKQASDLESRARQLFEIKGISQQDYDKTANTLNMIRAQREAIQAEIAQTEIVAPFDGIIGLRYVSPGSYVSTDMLVATLDDIDPVKVEFSVPEKYARQIKKGNVITVRWVIPKRV